MIFYLIPPRTNIKLADFNEYCNSRFNYLLKIAETKNYETSEEKLPLDTEIDQAGHFILRCLCAYKPDVKEFIITRETDLFSYRLKTMSWEKKRKSCQDVMKQISQLQNYHEFNPIKQRVEHPCVGKLLWSTLFNTCEALLISGIGDHLNMDCEVNCDKYLLRVAFQMCLSLIRDRSVVVENGFAFVPCSMWNLLLVELFTHHYEFGLSMISNTILSQLRSDVRWILAFDQLSKSYYHFKQSGLFIPGTLLTARQIDNEKRYFPPCMAHLLSVLQTNHRLSHNWRYRFSLFLKDIGLDVNESIEFWKNEYSKSCTAESSCTHSWQVNHRKFLYSIRHLYGLVGFGQKNEIKSCTAYQDMKLGMREEGGCPFVHFDDEHLLSSLSSEIINDSEVMNEIFRLRKVESPQKACYSYRTACAKKCRLQIPLEQFKSPVQYYQSMKLCLNTSLEW